MNSAFLPQEHVDILNRSHWTGTMVLISAWNTQGLELKAHLLLVGAVTQRHCR